MRKSLLALAMLGVFAGAASAQSSVTLSGVVDAGVARVGTATGYDWRVQGSQSAYNSFTLSGVEDLGGGLKATFLLNHRFRINNGTVNSPTNAGDGSVFWRNAAVGLAGAFGDVRLGRILMPLQTLNGEYEPFAVGTVGNVHTGGGNATIRANNAIYYRSPTMGGLSVQAAVAEAQGQNQGVNGLGEIGGGLPGSVTPTAFLGRERPIGVAVKYAAGPLSVGVAYDRNTGDMKTAGIYGSYNFGSFKLMSQFEKGDNCTSVTTTCTAPAVRAPGGVVTTHGQDDIKVLSVGVNVPVGQFLVRAGYARVDSKLANGDGSKFGFGGDYSLSKRTNLYADVGKITGDRYTAAAKKVMFDLGVTHRF